MRPLPWVHISRYADAHLPFLPRVGSAQEIRDAFNLFDTDHSGQIDYRELKVMEI